MGECRVVGGCRVVKMLSRVGGCSVVQFVVGTYRYYLQQSLISLKLRLTE